MVETLFFDIGGVLLNIHPDRTINYLQECTGLSPEIIREALTDDLHDLYEKGILNDDEFFEGYRYNLPQPDILNKEDFFAGWLKLLGKPTKIMKLAERLNNDYNVFLISNTNPFHISYGEKRDIFAKVKGYFYSYEFGMRKPNKDFFNAALVLSKANPDTSLFIDDKIENVIAAAEMGFNIIHYLSESQCKRELVKMLESA